MTNEKITILGIGNLLYSDEGVGIHALPLIEEQLSSFENIEIVEGATDGIKLLGVVEDTDYLIIIDAINAGKEEGAIIQLVGDDIPAYFGIKMSIHQLGFQEVLLAARMRETYPKQIVLFGIQPASLELGVQLSPVVQTKLPELAKLIGQQVRTWRDA